jgi:hypothetical protein
MSDAVFNYLKTNVSYKIAIAISLALAIYIVFVFVKF